MHVNRPPSLPQGGGADGRLYLREAELDLGADIIRSAARALRRRALEAADAADLLDAELDVLIEIYSAEGLDVGELRARLDAPKQSIARNLKSLDAKGLINRTPCRFDGRRRLLSLTPDGKAIAERAAEGWRAALIDAYKSAGADAVAGARGLLSAVAAAPPAADDKDTA